VPLRVRSATRATAADGEQSFRGGHRQRMSSTTCSRATSTLRWWTSAPLRPTSGLREPVGERPDSLL